MEPTLPKFSPHCIGVLLDSFRNYTGEFIIQTVEKFKTAVAFGQVTQQQLYNYYLFYTQGINSQALDLNGFAALDSISGDFLLSHIDPLLPATATINNDQGQTVLTLSPGQSPLFASTNFIDPLNGGLVLENATLDFYNCVLIYKGV